MGRKKIQDEDVYEVQAILDEKSVRNRHLYKIHWKGWPVDEATWECEENLAGAAELLKKWKNKQERLKLLEQKPQQKPQQKLAPELKTGTRVLRSNAILENATNNKPNITNAKERRNQKNKDEQSQTTNADLKKKPENGEKIGSPSKVQKKSTNMQQDNGKKNEKREDIVNDMKLPERKPVSIDTNSLLKKVHSELNPSKNAKKNMLPKFPKQNHRSPQKTGFIKKDTSSSSCDDENEVEIIKGDELKNQNLIEEEFVDPEVSNEETEIKKQDSKRTTKQQPKRKAGSNQRKTDQEFGLSMREEEEAPKMKEKAIEILNIDDEETLEEKLKSKRVLTSDSILDEKSKKRKIADEEDGDQNKNKKRKTVDEVGKTKKSNQSLLDVQSKKQRALAASLVKAQLSPVKRKLSSEFDEVKTMDFEDYFSPIKK